MRFDGIRGALHAPVLSAPVLIVESDDWGPGAGEQVGALTALRALLRRFRDGRGRHPVMTVGVVLSIPDGAAILESGRYRDRRLDAPRYRAIVETLRAGEAEGVFALQLHGLAHYWPANLMTALEDKRIGRWLEEDGWRTEELPPWLQSRWIDAVDGLPSRPLEGGVIRRAVREEIEVFRHCFGHRPEVVVPPTFVWNEHVEAAYAEAGIEVLITPGRRYPGRDAAGRLLPPERVYHDGERLAGGMTALVRDVYFEPALGHRPEDTLAAVAGKWRRREPALLETHRFNFLDGRLDASLAALERLLRQVLERFPEVRFLSSRELAREMEVMADRRPWTRLRTAWRRLRR